MTVVGETSEEFLPKQKTGGSREWGEEEMDVDTGAEGGVYCGVEVGG